MSSSPQATSVIKVAILLPSLQVGGAERLVMEELAYLKDDPRFSFEVHLVFEKGPFFERASTLGIPIRVWDAPHKSLWMLMTYAQIILHLRKSRCGILHSHLLDSIGPLVGKLAGAKAISTVHNDKEYSLIERHVLAMSDLALGCGQQVVQNIRRFISRKKVATLSNAIEKPSLQNNLRENVYDQFGINKGCKLIVTLGRLTRQKGFDVLIKAFRKVADEVPHAVLLIGGDGEEKVELVSLAQTIGRGASILMPGLISDTNELMSVCDLYVNSSRWEGLPMTLLEAMAHGRAMIATCVGGNPEVVHDGVTGILVQPDDPEDLAKAMIRMLTDDPFRESAAAAAKELFIREYTIEKHCETLKDYYFHVFQGNSE